MKLKSFLIAAVLAFAGGILISSTARAVSAAAPDLLLAFRIKDSIGQGASANLEVDIGSIVFDGTAIVYTAPGGSPVTLTAGQTLHFSGANGLAAQDLRSTYGDGSTDGSWNSRSSLVWSVSGTNGAAGANSLWVTSPGNTFTLNRAASQSGPGGRINTLYNAVQGTTANSSASVIVSTSQSNSYSTEIRNGNPGILTKDYNYFSHTIESGVVSSGLVAADLYQLDQGTGSGLDLGTFTLDSAGDFTFVTAAAAVPEPSTCALLVFTVLLLLTRHRFSPIKIRSTIGLWFSMASFCAAGAEQYPSSAEPGPNKKEEHSIYIREYRVHGAHLLPPVEVEEAVYAFLGPGRSSEDVEHARAALEKAYQEKGFQTVSVEIPQQQVKGGIVSLQVVEATVGRLRVKGSRYYSLNKIKAGAPSLTEGRVPNFNEITQDIVSLNQLPDRRVTPTLRAGVVPGTVDIDLTVKDTLPLHGSLELNNRYSSNTTALRVNGSVSYNNLWQLGHSIGASFQIAPERPDDARVFSGYYLARLPNVNWLSVILQGTKQDSNVSTLGGIDVAGRGEVLGIRAAATLPAIGSFFHSLSLGVDYKHFDQNILLAGVEIKTPTTYYPISVSYSATWLEKGSETDLNAGLTFGVRAGDQTVFDASRFKADENFIYFRGDLSHSHDLPWGLQLYGKVQGQIADQPLLNSEQFSGGGLGTVRGYLESAALGDNALFGSVELRSPSLFHWSGEKNEWRCYVFCDGGYLTLNDPLPEQESHFTLASYGVGSRIRMFDHLNGSLDLGVPLTNPSNTKANNLLVTFRVWADF